MSPDVFLLGGGVSPHFISIVKQTSKIFLKYKKGIFLIIFFVGISITVVVNFV